MQVCKKSAGSSCIAPRSCKPLAIHCHQTPVVTSCSTSGRQPDAACLIKPDTPSPAQPWSTPVRWATSMAAALVVATSFSSPAAYAALASFQAYGSMGEQGAMPTMTAEEARYDENLMTSELRDFLELLEKKGDNIKASDLEGPRTKVGFRRTVDGRVSLRGRDGGWYSVKADMQTPGFLLLRSEADGTMYYLPPDDAGQILQVDLSDDAVVASLFASGAWFDVMDQLKVQSGSRVIPLQLSASEFRLTTSLLQDAEAESDM